MKKNKDNFILINANPSHIRIAQVKEGVLFNFHWENCSAPSQVGAIYKAQVTKKQAGLDACFINIGLAGSAFLYTGKKVFKKTQKEALVEQSGQVNKRVSKNQVIPDNTKIKNISDIKNLKQGQNLMVQVVKDPLKGKSLRVSDKISLPGIYLVYLPNSPFHIGISRQIEDEKTREKLIHCVQKWNNGEALIVRTKAAQASEEDLKKDWEILKNTWQNIQEKYRSQKTLGLIWSDIPVFAQVLRDFLTKETEEVFVDDEKIFLYLQEFASKNLPKGKYKISNYKNKKLSLFDKYDLEPEVERLLRKKVRLSSGGFIVIEETEAAVIVDVNTGSFMGTKTPAENILKINLEAAKEIAIQIRLRNCGGIILIDFIDMETEQSRQQVMELLSYELEKDRAPTQLFPMSELAVVQLTRKRVRSSLLETVCVPCSHCGGLSYY